jgi:hypothetical protein
VDHTQKNVKNEHATVAALTIVMDQIVNVKKFQSKIHLQSLSAYLALKRAARQASQTVAQISVIPSTFVLESKLFSTQPHVIKNFHAVPSGAHGANGHSRVRHAVMPPDTDNELMFVTHYALTHKQVNRLTLVAVPIHMEIASHGAVDIAPAKLLKTHMELESLTSALVHTARLVHIPALIIFVQKPQPPKLSVHPLHVRTNHLYATGRDLADPTIYHYHKHHGISNHKPVLNTVKFMAKSELGMK